MAAVAEQLGAFGAAVRSARAEADRTQTAIRAGAEGGLFERDRADHAELVARLRAAQAEPGDEGDADTERRHAWRGPRARPEPTRPKCA